MTSNASRILPTDFVDGPYPAGVEDLTEREREVLRAYAQHGIHKLMAHALGMAEQTLKNHVTSAMRKLNVATCGQAAIILDRVENQRQPTWPQIDRRSGWERRRRPS